MSSLADRSTENLLDLIFNVKWHNLLEVWKELRDRLDVEGAEELRKQYLAAVQRFKEGPLKDRMEVRWGMDLCMLCNDNNIEKNGIAYAKLSGDGIEFNQCLNCKIGILYSLEMANATFDSYVISIGQPDQFAGMSIFWVSIPCKEMEKFQPLYELVNLGEWIGSLSFDSSLQPRFLPKAAMTADTPRDAENVWTTNIPDDVRAAIDAFLVEAKYQVEVAQAFR